MPMDMFPQTSDIWLKIHRYVPIWRHQSARIEPHRDLCVATKTNYVEILNFRHFFKHIVFTSEGDKIRNKEIKNYINVSVVVDIECGNTTE